MGDSREKSRKIREVEPEPEELEAIEKVKEEGVWIDAKELLSGSGEEREEEES